MTDFHLFATAVHQQYSAMAKHELFTTDGDADVFAAYLAAFPPGSNPIFRTNTEHDCSCCKNFVRNLGTVVSLATGKVETVWDIPTVGYPYDDVAKAMAAHVRSRALKSIYRTKERQYGAEFSRETLPDGSTRRWNHFHGKVADKHFSATPEAVRGEYDAKLQVFRRGLTELKLDVLDDILELIDTKALYRGEEHERAVRNFRTTLMAYNAVQDEGQRVIFQTVNATTPAAQFRNTVIGTLAQDLSSGKPMDAAVKAFEDKVAPHNYKRPTALITPRMVDDAMKTIHAEGLEPALERRLATIADVSINDVLWVDRDDAKLMKGGIAELLMDAAVPTKLPISANFTSITIDDFMTRVLPKAKRMELFVANKHRPNFVTLTAPKHADAPPLFKWGNGFAWSYSGNIADSSIRSAVQARGGKIDGVFRFSHQWNHEGRRNGSLMDLHVFMPGNDTGGKRGGGGATAGTAYGNSSRVGWNNRKHATSGGVQDVDYVDVAPPGYIPVENITFPDLKRMPEGDYRCVVHNWQERAPNEGGFKAEIEFAGQIFEYDYPKPVKNGEWVPVATVTLKAGQFSIDHHMPTGAQSVDVWGVKTEKLTRVRTLMLSPNYWGDKAVGNKHWIFVLEGAAVDEPARGIYNEFLKPEYEKHRKVFEVLGNKTKCQPTADQLSGLGFSSTRGDTVDVAVASAAGTRNYTLTF